MTTRDLTGRRGWKAHNAMTPEQHAVIRDGYLNRRKQGDVAKQIGVNENTVRKHYGYLDAEGIERAPKQRTA